MKAKAKPKIAALALAAALAIPITAPITAPTAQASGIPTVDVAAIVQAILQVMESIEQTTALMDQYQTQLEQYENQLQHSLAPAAYIWEQASLTMSKLERAQAMLDVYNRQLGGLEGYLDQFKDISWYKRSPCFSKNGCTPEELEAMRELKERMDKTQVQTNRAAAESATKQLDNTKKYTENLAQIKQQASRAQGQLQAIGATNQLAGFQGDQLIDINTQLATLIQLLAAQKQAEEDKQRRLEAADEAALYTGNIKPSPRKGWLP
ncbi:hypothetical protein AXE65_04205 [Ventosimonas gracilis]|uniref:Conjugal transfer protein TrbJ n=1 Tax=Ventosimonas gracilis TaxID=1680762 RepID=A0A139SR08_9GAMM|nr:P-type conjugative transfer protein TrbJ [Ventosimonas gracilis]KXU36988.1 hypothetical protein AXE65_04205 [Ventosimonas gracilis]